MPSVPGQVSSAKRPVPSVPRQATRAKQPTPIVQRQASCAKRPTPNDSVQQLVTHSELGDSVVDSNGYRLVLETRALDVKSALTFLQGTEEWRSITDHNRYISYLISDGYLDEMNWMILRCKILDSISTYAYLKEDVTRFLKVATSIRSNKFTAEKTAIMNEFCLNDVSINKTDVTFTSEWKHSLFILGYEFIYIIQKNLPHGN